MRVFVEFFGLVEPILNLTMFKEILKFLNRRRFIILRSAFDVLQHRLQVCVTHLSHRVLWVLLEKIVVK
jgi:hypothetical protein